MVNTRRSASGDGVRTRIAGQSEDTRQINPGKRGGWGAAGHETVGFAIIRTRISGNSMGIKARRNPRNGAHKSVVNDVRSPASGCCGKLQGSKGTAAELPGDNPQMSGPLSNGESPGFQRKTMFPPESQSVLAQSTCREIPM